jgi:hypothetical protein
MLKNYLARCMWRVLPNLAGKSGPSPVTYAVTSPSGNTSYTLYRVKQFDQTNDEAGSDGMILFNTQTLFQLQSTDLDNAGAPIPLISYLLTPGNGPNAGVTYFIEKVVLDNTLAVFNCYCRKFIV